MKNPSVIVVTHDLVLRESLFEHFFHAGWKVADEATVSDVARRAVKSKPHIIVIDDRQENVLESLRAWSLSPLLRKVPVAILTSFMQAKKVEEYLDAGATTVMPLSMYHPGTVVKLMGKLL